MTRANAIPDGFEKEDFSVHIGQALQSQLLCNCFAHKFSSESYPVTCALKVKNKTANRGYANEPRFACRTSCTNQFLRPCVESAAYFCFLVF